MKIRVGQVFRVPSRTAPRDCCDAATLDELSTARFPSRLDPVPGIAFWSKVGQGAQARRPAIVLFSNPFVENRDESPWVDLIDPDRGYARYYGDAKSASSRQRGNQVILDEFPLYSVPASREQAAPVLIFRQVQSCGSTAGHREFCGYGVPTKLEVIALPERGTRQAYSNIRLEVALLGLEDEREEFDWQWVDDRRDPSLSNTEALRKAPAKWRRWVSGGEAVLPQLRRNVLYHHIQGRSFQVPADGSSDRAILDRVCQFYAGRPHDFEVIAPWFVQRAMPLFTPAWVTKRSGDGGFDFVGRLEFEGRRVGPKGVVILGESKLYRPSGTVSGSDLARLVARLRRGWFGAFVTTAAFSNAAQKELLEDSYPVFLLTGLDVAQYLREFMGQNRVPDVPSALTQLHHDLGLQVLDVPRDPDSVMW